MSARSAPYRKPTGLEALFNSAWGFLVRAGLGFGHSYLLEVQGRKSGRLYATPVNLLVLEGRRYLVAPRGVTAWVRNARAAGEIALRRGSARQSYRLRELPDAEKPAVLRAYLEKFKTSVRQFFSVPPGAPEEAFAAVAASHPVFELTGSPADGGRP